MKFIAATTAALAVASGAAARSLQQAPAMAPVATAAFTPAMPAITDADILQFALQLEYLEAAFYSCATTGAPLPASVAGSTTVITEGCARGNYTEETYDVFGEIAADELNHVKYLQSALTAAGATPVPQPQLNLTFLTTAAQLAYPDVVQNPPFMYTTNDLFGYLAAYVFEDVGVTAYNGAIPAITSKPYTSAAASILAIEAYHAGLVRKTLYDNADEETPYGQTVAQVADRISQLRGNLTIQVDNATAPMGEDEGITTNDTTTIVPADANSLAFMRTPQEVIAIVSGFFPLGLNGNIK